MTTDTDAPRYRLDRERENIRELADNGDMPAELADRILALSDALDPEYPGTKLVKEDGEVEEYAPGSVFQYIHLLKRWYMLTGVDYTTATADEINKLAAEMDTGRHPDCPPKMREKGGYSRQTVNKFLCAAKAFYDFHTDLGITRSDVDMFKKANAVAYDDRDMFSRDDIQALRDEMRDTRWRALLEMLIYSGQRIRAILTLRIKDFETKDGYYYLNSDVDGLKGADKRGRKRPLFGARKFVRDWIDYHPLSDDDEAFVFIGDPSNPATKLDKPISERSVRRTLKEAGEDAGLDTEVKAHKFRHYFVTVMKRDYGLDDGVIKFLMGHSEHSNVMNTTYKHISSEDYIDQAEEALGYKEPKTRNSFVPEVCDVCEEPLQPNWKRCPACDEVYAPDAEEYEHQLSEAMFESAIEVEDMDQAEAIRIMQRWATENPVATANAITEAMMGQSNDRRNA